MSEDHKIQKNPARERFTILLAEDDFAIANMLQLALTMGGYKVVLAENGKVAADRIIDNKPQLILLDINMPIMQGFETVDDIKKRGYNLSSSKIVFLTNSSSEGDIERAKSLGADYKIKADLTPLELLFMADKKLGLS